MNLRTRAKSLRINQTNAEEHLWYFLRAHRFMGLKFRRQTPMGHYVVDFLCHDAKLIIELDGGQHLENENYDQARDTWLKSQGYRVLRFWNHDVLRQTEAVLESIRLAVS